MVVRVWFVRVVNGGVRVVVVEALLGEHRVHARERVGVAVAVEVGAQQQAVARLDVAHLVLCGGRVEHRRSLAARLEQLDLVVAARAVVHGIAEGWRGGQVVLRDHQLRAARGAEDDRGRMVRVERQHLHGGPEQRGSGVGRPAREARDDVGHRRAGVVQVAAQRLVGGGLLVTKVDARRILGRAVHDGFDGHDLDGVRVPVGRAGHVRGGVRRVGRVAVRAVVGQGDCDPLVDAIFGENDLDAVVRRGEPAGPGSGGVVREDRDVGRLHVGAAGPVAQLVRRGVVALEEDLVLAVLADDDERVVRAVAVGVKGRDAHRVLHRARGVFQLLVTDAAHLLARHAGHRVLGRADGRVLLPAHQHELRILGVAEVDLVGRRAVGDHHKVHRVVLGVVLERGHVAHVVVLVAQQHGWMVVARVAVAEHDVRAVLRADDEVLDAVIVDVGHLHDAVDVGGQRARLLGRVLLRELEELLHGRPLVEHLIVLPHGARARREEFGRRARVSAALAGPERHHAAAVALVGGVVGVLERAHLRVRPAGRVGWVVESVLKGRLALLRVRVLFEARAGCGHEHLHLDPVRVVL